MSDMDRFLDEVHDLWEELRMESLDNVYSEAEQKRLKKAAREVREVWMELRRRMFDKNTPGFVEAKGKLDEVNEELNEAKERLEKVEEFLDKVRELLGFCNQIIAAVA